MVTVSWVRIPAEHDERGCHHEQEPQQAVEGGRRESVNIDTKAPPTESKTTAPAIRTTSRPTPCRQEGKNERGAGERGHRHFHSGGVPEPTRNVDQQQQGDRHHHNHQNQAEPVDKGVALLVLLPTLSHGGEPSEDHPDPQGSKSVQAVDCGDYG